MVHVLLFGRPLCGIYPGKVPGEWPEGERWTYVEDAAENATCQTCKALAPGMIERFPEIFRGRKSTKGSDRPSNK